MWKAAGLVVATGVRAGGRVARLGVPLALPVTAQLVTSGGVCREGVYTAPGGSFGTATAFTGGQR